MINLKRYLKKSIPFVLSLFLALVLACPWGNEERAQLSAYSEKWNDLDNFRANLSTRYNISCIISTPLIISSQTNTLLIAAGVEKPYNEQELEFIERFVRQGGKVILADDFGYGNELARRYGVAFYALQLWCENYTQNANFSRVKASIGNVTYNLTLNVPTGLKIFKEIETLKVNVIAAVTAEGYIDSNDNLYIDLLDESATASRPIYVILELKPTNGNNGSIVFVSDPGLFTNGLWLEDDNAKFLQGLVSYLLQPGGSVIFDESRHLTAHESISMFTRLVIFLTTGNLAILALATLLVIIFIFLASIKKEVGLEHKFMPDYCKKAARKYNIKDLQLIVKKMAEAYPNKRVVFDRMYTEKELLDMIRRLSL